jgi:predicted RNase H-related nuclease YkuK (DUF458 family)
MDTIHEQSDYPKAATLESFRAMVQESSKKFDLQMEKSRKEADLEMQEIRQIIKENTRESKERSKEIDKKISKLGERFGEMTEYLVVPNLVEKFRKLGFDFRKCHQNEEIIDRENDIITEVDITLENSEKVMIIEVKTKPSTDDVKDHIERMKKIRRHADLHGDKRRFLGTIAGMVIKENVRDFIHKNGFFAIEPSGETFVILPPKREAKEW